MAYFYQQKFPMPAIVNFSISKSIQKVSYFIELHDN